MRKFFISAFLLLTLSFVSYGQRMIPGQQVVSLSGNGWYQYGGSASWSMVSYIGRLTAGVTFVTGPMESYYVAPSKQTLEANFNVLDRDVYASVGYMFRVASDRSKMFNLMLGGTFDLGARIYKVVSDVPSYGVPSAKFIYGLSPKIEFEIFPAKSLSISVFGIPRIQLYGHKQFDRFFYPEFGLGVNYYFFVR